MGCHRPRVPDEICFRGILHRLVSGSSWTTVEAQLGWVVSDTTLRARFNEWIAAGYENRNRWSHSYWNYFVYSRYRYSHV